MADMPTHLSIFVRDGDTGMPLTRLPIYAEVGMVGLDEMLAVDGRFTDPLYRAVRATDSEYETDPASLRRAVEAIEQGFSRQLTKRARDKLHESYNLLNEFSTRVLQRAREARGGDSLVGLDAAILRDLISTAIRNLAGDHGLELVAASEPARWAYPLGVLATDHAGYLSFDLRRLPTRIRQGIDEAMNARRDGSVEQVRTTVLLHPLAGGLQAVDALGQARFADDAVVVLLELENPQLPPMVRNAGFPALQNPDLTDWRLSPASFAANPASLLGADGSESIMPANLALQEFNFYQVVRLTDVRVPDLPEGLRRQVRLGFVHDYQVTWYPLGHSLGEIQYSLPLAPGESVNLAVIDWARRDEAERGEDTKLDEQLQHGQRRERTITETVDAAIREFQEGSSFLAGLASSVGASGTLGALGVAAGWAGSLGGASSDSRGSRDISATTVQQLTDNIAQASAASRAFHSTVVVRATQSEKEAIETRTIVNYNHSHALTILYYEVLRHYRVVTELVDRRPVVLVDLNNGLLAGGGRRLPAAVAFALERSVLEHRTILEPALLEKRHVEGFNALQRVVHRRELTNLQTPSAHPEIKQFTQFEFYIRSGGLAAAIGDPDQLVGIQATLKLLGERTVELRSPKGGRALNESGSFTQEHGDNGPFIAVLPPGTAPLDWDDITLLQLQVHLHNLDDASFAHIKVVARDTTGAPTDLVDQTYPGHLVLRGSEDGVVVRDIPISVRPAPQPVNPGEPPQDVEDMARKNELMSHLRYHRAYYDRVLLLGLDQASREHLLDEKKLDDGSSLLDRVENRVLETYGGAAVLPCTNRKWSQEIFRKTEPAEPDEPLEPDEPPFRERLVTLPTRGVFAEAKLGHDNASEVINNTRFWDWQQSPIPHMAPEIAPIQAGQHTVADPNLTSTPFPQSMVNIVNPPSAPDPTGLAAALNALVTPNVFRDMSGRAEVTDLLKRLSDNSINIAQAANRAREIQAKYGSGSAALGAGSGGGGLGSPRATPTQPSAVNRDLKDRIDTLAWAGDAGHLTPEAVRDGVARAVEEASLPLEQIGDKFVRPAYTPNELAGIVGECHADEALRARKMTVFSDWRKHVSGTGFDMAAYDPADKSLWIVDNKASTRGIGGANALTGAYFNTYMKNLRAFLEKTWPNKIEADLALAALDSRRVKLVVTNGFAGDAARFTRGVFEQGLHVFDIRINGGTLYSPTGPGGWQAAHQEWSNAFKALTPVKGARVRSRGCVSVGPMLLIVGIIGARYIMVKVGSEFRAIVGEVAANVALDLTVSMFPGGAFASLFLSLESDETSEQREARKRKELVDELLSSLPGVDSLSAAELQSTREALETIIKGPLVIPEPPALPTYPVAPASRYPLPFTPPPGTHT